MQIFTYTDARNNLKTVLDRVIDDSDVAVITRGKKVNMRL
jgi:antitoxin YefM